MEKITKKSFVEALTTNVSVLVGMFLTSLMKLYRQLLTA